MNKESMKRVIEIGRQMDAYQSQIDKLSLYGDYQALAIEYVYKGKDGGARVQRFDIENASDIVDFIFEDRKRKMHELEEELEEM